MSIFEICQWIQNSSIGTGIRESTYVFPLVEATHVLGLAVSVGTMRSWISASLAPRSRKSP